MSGRLRVLALTSFLPRHDSVAGGGIYLRGLVAELAARYDVTLATFTEGQPGEAEAVADLIAHGIRVHTVPRPCAGGAAGWVRRGSLALRWLRTRQPLRVLAFAHPAMQRTVEQLLAERVFDLVQLEDIAMATYVRGVRIPTVLTELEARSSGGAAGRRGMAAPVLREEALRWQRHQKEVWRRFERVQVFTPEDAATIRSLVPEVAGRIRVNPFGVALPPSPCVGGEETGRVVFLGGFRHPPNVDAARWLAREIMPALRMRAPGVRLALVGADPPRSVRALACEDVEVTGRVPSIAPVLAAASVVLAPVRSGGGMRVKVLQAMAAGKAVVTTPLGAAGLAPFGGDPPLVVAADAGSIAAATASLLADAAARSALGRRARAFVEAHHGWDAYGRRLAETYAELIAPGPLEG